MTDATGPSRRFAIYRIGRLVATRTRQLLLRVAREPGNRSHPLHMYGVKLFTAPQLVRIRWLSRHRDLFRCPIAVVKTLPRPLGILYRIAKRAAMRSAHALAVVRLPVRIVVALRAGGQRRFARLEVSALVLRVTRRATDGRITMWLDDGGDKGCGVMTTSAVRFHASPERMARRAGVRTGPGGDRRKQS